MYCFPYGINSDLEAARIITVSFPNRSHKRIDEHIDCAQLSHALMYARTKCASSYLTQCVKWARDYMKNGSTCQGCKHLWMNNSGSFECVINAEHICIDKSNKYIRTMKEE